jgi:predicted RNase H-like nuclease
MKAIGVIGIDCATQAKKTGLALGFFEGGATNLVDVSIKVNPPALIDMILDWIGQSELTLIALDAPLDWPAELGNTLGLHKAGQAIVVEPNYLFRRYTDRFIKSKIGKQPLDVGADRIARTAHMTLSLLDKVRQKMGDVIPLAWEPGRLNETSTIEVYPAATLLAHRIHVPGYKQKENVLARKHLIAKLKSLINLEMNTALIVQNDDLGTARKEGWIWVCRQTR